MRFVLQFMYHCTNLANPVLSSILLSNNTLKKLQTGFPNSIKTIKRNVAIILSKCVKTVYVYRISYNVNPKTNVYNCAVN